ncbi:MAG: penicillin acylase family protein, partial [Pseudomonadota bacterium]
MTDRSNAVGARVSQAFGLAGLASWLLRRTVTKRFPKLTLEQRLAMVPTMLGGIEAPITIRWNAQHIPIVEAQCAGDAAAGLGVVHGHLRLAQIELMRRAAYGRLSEIAGPAAVDLDALLRLVDFPRTTAPSLAMMPAETRAWIEGFCAGLSATAAARPLPPEFEIFQIAPEPFTPQDIFAVSRLCSADYAWRVWRALSALRQSDRWERLWSDLVGLAGGDRRPIGDDTGDQTGDDTHPSLMPDWSQKGSNAMAVAGARTQSGKPLFACDPHLVLTSPSPWMIAGVSAPQLDTVGLMIPALPIFG